MHVQETSLGMVEDRQVRFVLLGGFGPRRGGEAQQRPLIDWVRANGRLVDPALWRSTTAVGPGLDPGRRPLPPGDGDPAVRPGSSGRGFPGRPGRPQLYDLRPTDGIVPALSSLAEQ